ncbi:MAG: type fimbrial assembly protein PilB [Schlesneria sp.]|nr:type fimbrial assembly protein PilB [Schlesneria sp.]
MFDPYRKWLGIPPKDQPPNHYRLLGVELFESDLDVIEGAAERQMNFVRQYQSGEYATAAAKILNELAIARLCLLKPATKTAYDKKLRSDQARLSAAEQQFSDVAFDDLQPAPRKRTRKPKPVSANQSLLIGGGIAALIIVLAVVMLPRGRRNPSVDQSSTITAATPAPSIEKPTPPAKIDPPSPDSLLWTEPKLVAERAGNPIDLMKSVDIARDVALGEWKQTATALIAAPHSRLYVPGKLPDDYQINLVARRLDGTQGLFVGFMMAGRQGVAIVDAWGSTVSGLYVDGREVNDNSTTFRSKPLADHTIQIAITIHPGHFHMAVDGKTITNWHGNPEQLSLFFGLGSRESLFFATADSGFVIESATLVPIKPEPPYPRPDRLTDSVDVQSLIDLDRDTQRGIWGANKGKISSPEGLGQVCLPVMVPEEYTLSTKVLRPESAGGEPTVMFGLIAGQSRCRITLKSDEGVALDMIDGRRWNENGTRLEVPFCRPGVPAQVDFTVTKQGVRMEVDGKTFIDWQGDFWRLSSPDEWATADHRKLFIATKSHFQFSDIKLGPPKPARPFPRHDKITTDRPLDLLSIIDPVRDANQGTWTSEGHVLRTMADPAFEYSKLAIPVDVPEEYLLTMQVAREAGGPHNDEALCLLLPFGNSRAGLVIDGHHSQFTGFDLSKSDFASNPTTFKGTVISPDAATEIEIQVRKNGVKISSAGRQIVDWSGNPANFTVQPRHAGPGRGISLGAWKQRFRFEKLEIRALPPTSLAAIPALPADGNLLPVIDIARDVREGTWTIGAEGLQSPDQYMISRLRIPFTPPSKYALELMVERRGGVSDLLIGLPIDGRPCLVAFDGSFGKRAGLELVDGHWIYDAANFTARGTDSHLLPQGQRVNVTCFVLPDTLVVNCGDREIVRWHGDARRLSLAHRYLPPNYSDEDQKLLWLGSWATNFRITNLILRPLTTDEITELSTSFTGVSPTTSQSAVPLTTRAKMTESSNRN